MSRLSPLHQVHEARGARFVDFGGWEMPVQYESVLAEHRMVRMEAGWFDVSHLGRFSLRGPGSVESLVALLCNDIRRIDPGRTQYTLMLNDHGGAIDDLVIWRWGDEDFTVLPNAANHERVMSAFGEFGADAADLRDITVSIAVQGPSAPAALEAVFGESPRRFRTMRATFGHTPVLVAGTGYTGEPGGEIVCPVEIAEDVVVALEAQGVGACGLGARDTLRLEAGLPLWGQELDEETGPLEAGLAFAVSFDHDFRGKEALDRQLAEGLPKHLIGFVTEGRRVARHGQTLRAGSTDGWVTSGNFSPMLERGIGLGYLRGAVDGPLEVEIRGEWFEVTAAETPFYRR